MSTSSSKQDISDDEFESADEGEPTSPSIIKPPTPPPSDPLPIIKPVTPPPPPIIKPATPSPAPTVKSPTPPPPPIIKSPTPPPPPPSIIKLPTPSPSPPPSPSHTVPSTLIENQVQSVSLPPAVNDGWGDWNIDDDQPIETSIKFSNTLQQDSVSSRSSSPSKTGGSLSQIGSDEDDQCEFSDQQRLQRKKYRKKEETKINTQISRPTGNLDEETASSSSTTTKHDVKDAHHVLDRLAAEAQTQAVDF